MKQYIPCWGIFPVYAFVFPFQSCKTNISNVFFFVLTGQRFAMLEIKTIIAKILLNFKVTLCKDKEIRLQPDVILKPMNGIHVNLQLRE